MGQDVMSTVSYLKPAEDAVLPVDDALIAMLEDLLDHARGGNIQGMIFATIKADGCGVLVHTASGWVGNGVHANVQAVTGALTFLQHRFVADKMTTEK